MAHASARQLRTRFRKKGGSEDLIKLNYISSLACFRSSAIEKFRKVLNLRNGAGSPFADR